MSSFADEFINDPYLRGRVDLKEEIDGGYAKVYVTSNRKASIRMARWAGYAKMTALRNIINQLPEETGENVEGGL